MVMAGTRRQDLPDTSKLAQLHINTLAPKQLDGGNWQEVAEEHTWSTFTRCCSGMVSGPASSAGASSGARPPCSDLVRRAISIC